MALESVFYGLLGIVLMIVGLVIVDIAIPYDFFKEIFEEKNPAVGAMAAGLFIAIAIIIRYSIIN